MILSMLPTFVPSLPTIDEDPSLDLLLEAEAVEESTLDKLGTGMYSTAAEVLWRYRILEDCNEQVEYAAIDIAIAEIDEYLPYLCSSINRETLEGHINAYGPQVVGKYLNHALLLKNLKLAKSLLLLAMPANPESIYIIIKKSSTILHCCWDCLWVWFFHPRIFWKSIIT